MIETVSVALPYPPDNDIALKARLPGHAPASDSCRLAGTAMIVLRGRPVTFETEHEHHREGQAGGFSRLIANDAPRRRNGTCKRYCNARGRTGSRWWTGGHEDRQC